MMKRISIYIVGAIIFSFMFCGTDGWIRGQVTDRIQMLSGVIDEHNAARAKAMEEINKQLDEAKRDLAYLDEKFLSA